MTRPDYNSVVAIRTVKKKAERGYAFETAIREIFPWTFRPPIAVVGDSEQLDSFFEWNSWHFLVEAKAKAEPIQRGAHDWEDFELKVRRREGSCVGLFCSLFDVSPAAVAAAEELNKKGITTIVLAGGFWDELQESPLPLSDVLRYMVAHARAKFIAAPPSVKAIQEYVYDLDATEDQLRTFAQTQSATFLRRHRLARHDDVYVKRSIDTSIQGFTRALKPSALHSLGRKRKRADHVYSTARSRPSQLLVVRDASGAGKTTATVQLALERAGFVGIAHAAIEPDLDNLLTALKQVGEDYGLSKLKRVNLPLLVAVDSLDEAGHVPHKLPELNSLIKCLGELNDLARSYGLLAFPIGLMFTVREEYWERWSALFDGRPVTSLRHRFSMFTSDELSRAIERYAKAYGFRVVGDLSREGRQVLATPFNLLVFSEANEYLGPVAVDQVLTEGVLTLYFERKRQDVLKRHIPLLTESAVMLIAAEMAMHVVSKRTDELPWSEATEITVRVDPLQKANADDVVRALVSEQLLRPAGDDARRLRFRHTRFIEYLVAYHISHGLSAGQGTEFLQSRTDQIFDAPMVSMFRVHDLIRHICARDFPMYLDVVNDFYAQSGDYMTRNLSRLRGSIAHGRTTDSDDITLILRAGGSKDPEVMTNTFFVLAARPNEQPDELVLEAFKRAWQASQGRPGRWKLLRKLDDLDLLQDGDVFHAVAESGTHKEWEVYAGALLERGEHQSLRSMLFEAGMSLENLPEDRDWLQARGLLELALEGRDYIPGVRFD